MRSIGITHTDIERAIARARQERSRVALDLLGRVGRDGSEIPCVQPPTCSAAGTVNAGPSPSFAVSANRTLADMELHRSQIRAAVRALQDEAAPTTAVDLIEAPAVGAENLVPFPPVRRTQRQATRRHDAEPIRAAG